MVAITTHHKLSGLDQQKLIVPNSGGQRPENQGVDKAMLPLKALERNCSGPLSSLLVASRGPCRYIAPLLHLHVVFSLCLHIILPLCMPFPVSKFSHFYKNTSHN